MARDDGARRATPTVIIEGVVRNVSLAAASALLLLAPATAHAGTYEVVSCGAAPGRVNNAWVPEVSSPSIVATDACQSGGAFPADDLFIQFGGSLALYTKLGAPNPPVGAYGYWRLEVPDPLRITAARGTGHVHSEADGWRLVSEADFGETSHCQTNEPGSGINDHCDAGGGTYATPVPATASPYAQPTKWVRFGFRCTVAPCDTGSTAHAAGAAVFAEASTISDPVAPSVALSAIPAQAVSGGELSASVSGSDQTGVSRLELLVDGQVVASSVRSCDFTRVLPCDSPGGSVSAQLSAGRLTAGARQLTARVIDAAGNVANSAPQTVLVAAADPGPGPGSSPTTPSLPTPPPSTSPDVVTPPSTTPPTLTALTALGLRLSSVQRRGSKVRVRGRVTAGCRNRLTVKVRSAGRSRTVRVKADGSGRWSVWVSGVRGTSRVAVKVTAARTTSCGAGSVSATRR